MFTLKPIAKEAIPRALAKAERYRLLNEPREAESICQDVLAVEPENQEALVALILTVTDLFDGFARRVEEARPLVAKLKTEYERAYYGGMVEERWAKALLAAEYPPTSVLEVLLGAMARFEAADRLAPTENDDAVLRWNACVRLIDRHGLRAGEGSGRAGADEDAFEDDVPVR